MSNSTPAVRSNPAFAPAPIQANSQGVAPAPLEGISPVPAQQPTSLAPTSSPVAPAPVQSPAMNVAPALPAEPVVPPAPLTQQGANRVAPEPQWQNLFCFESLEQIINTINGSVRSRVKGYQDAFEELLKPPDSDQRSNEENEEAKKQELLRRQELLKKLQPGPQFAWSRVGYEPKISASLDDLSTLKNAVFGDEYDKNRFNERQHLAEAIAKLSDSLVALLLPPKIIGTSLPSMNTEEKEQRVKLIQDHLDKLQELYLEGLWIEFPKTNEKPSEDTGNSSESSTEKPPVPKLQIAVSILPSKHKDSGEEANNKAQLGPFSVDRIHLTFGDIQRDLPTRSDR